MDFHPDAITTKTTRETVAVLKDDFEYTVFGATYVYPAGHEFRFKGSPGSLKPKLTKEGVVIPLGRLADVLIPRSAFVLSGPDLTCTRVRIADVLIPRSAFVLYVDEMKTVTKVETTVTRTLKS